jgi:tRNA 2-thiouridine synthesizing protein A
LTNVASTLDASGLACPMPVVKTRLAIDQLDRGQVLQVISTDRGSLSDIPAWTGSMGHSLVAQHEEDGRFVFLIEKR